ncbi:hypothetical protein RRG08_032691 [Elysia crispata]|uniref:ETS domain-containing protein n=1 Tax=Elysia crispata TaxID=231223 RepID=A0AAE0Y095_9GAST|nr:hypothetical protein RRG08_032691 [Elysia crispata]
MRGREKLGSTDIKCLTQQPLDNTIHRSIQEWTADKVEINCCPPRCKTTKISTFTSRIAGTHIVCQPQFQTPVLLPTSGSAQTSTTVRQSFVPILPQPRRLSSNSTATTTRTTTTTTTISSTSGKISNSNIVSTASTSTPLCVPVSMLSPAPSERSSSGSDSSCVAADRRTLCDDANEAEAEVKPENGACASPCNEEGSLSGDGGCRLLWEFVYQLLQDQRFSDLVSWESQSDLTFRINNQSGLADFWGQQKNKDNMTYEKLSRALRYYYKMNIIKKVPGRRLTYRFLQHPTKIRRGQRGARPHASRVAAQVDVTADANFSVASDTVGNFEAKETIKPVPVSESEVDTQPSASPVSAASLSSSVNTTSEQGAAVTHSGVSSPSSYVSSESPMSLPALLSSSISVGSSFSMPGSSISPLPLLPNQCTDSKPGEPVQTYSQTSVESVTQVNSEPDFDDETTKESCENICSQTDALSSFAKGLEQELKEGESPRSADSKYVANRSTHGQQNRNDCLKKSPVGEDGINENGLVEDKQPCDSDLEPKPPHLPPWNQTLMNQNEQSKLDISADKSAQEEQGFHLRYSPRPHCGQTRDETPPVYVYMQQSQQTASCPSPLVYTELRPRHSSDVCRQSFSTGSPNEQGHLIDPQNSESTCLQQSTRTSEVTLQETLTDQSHQALPSSISHLSACVPMPNKYYDTNISESYIKQSTDPNSPGWQHSERSSQYSRPGSPHLKPYQQHHSDDLLGSTESHTYTRKSSLSPLTPQSCVNSSTPLTMQLHVSVSQLQPVDKKRAIEHTDICNMYPAHQKRICLPHRNISPFSMNYFPRSLDALQRTSLVCPHSQPDINNSGHVQPNISHVHHSRFMPNGSCLPQISIEPNFTDHCNALSSEFALPYTSSNVQVMDLSRPIKLERYDSGREQDELGGFPKSGPEQDEPEDLSMKPKHGQPVL